MGAVFAFAVDLAEELYLVESIIVVGGANAIQAAGILLAAIDDDIETVECPEQALGLADVGRDLLDLGLGGSPAQCRRRDAEQAAVLIRDNKAALGIDAHVDPGALGLSPAR